MELTETAAPAWASALTREALTALPADITTATPPQVDEVIRTVELDQMGITAAIGHAMDALRRALGQKQEQRATGRVDWRGRPEMEWYWPLSVGETMTAAAMAGPAARSAERLRGGPQTVGEATDAYDRACIERREAATVIERMEVEFARRGGWTRYFRVNNSNGHVHTSMACRECYATTQYNWPTALSGADGAGVVEAAGALTCLTCFPEQRADILAGRPTDFAAFETTEQRATRVEREQAAAERKAAKIAKGVTADGSPLMIEMSSHDLTGFGRVLEIKTENAAQLRYVELAAIATGTTQRWVRAADRPVAAAAARQLAEALAWKRNTSVDEIERTLAKKVAKKVAAETW